MPKSRQNKDRKENLLKFKNQQKQKFMSEAINKPEIRQIRQVPTWTQDAKFELTGGEFMAIQNFLNIFAEPVKVMEQVFSRHLDSGTIQVRYQDPEGREIPKQEVEDYLKQMQEYLSAQADVTLVSPEPVEAPSKKASKKLAKVENTNA